MLIYFSAVPQASEFLDPPTLSKGKTEKNKSRKKDGGKERTPAVIDMTGFTAFPPPRPLSAGDSPAPSGLEGRSLNSPAPPSMMKSSFSQVSEPASGMGTPVSGPSDRTKVAFGFGTKRKAGEEAKGSPPSKKR